jgi:hypothetical protein
MLRRAGREWLQVSLQRQVKLNLYGAGTMGITQRACTEILLGKIPGKPQ